MQSACVILPPVTCPALIYTLKLSHKRRDFRKKKPFRTKFMLLCYLPILYVIFPILIKTGREVIKCETWSSRRVEQKRNVMSHAQKPELALLRKGTSPFKSAGGSVQSTTGSRGVEETSGYPLHSPLSPSLPLPCVTVCHHVSFLLYQTFLSCFS